MAIVSISRIQHRRGLQENIPQLASAELGWSVDSRRLYIGNGTLEEGAPQLGRTEVLTEYSDILSMFAAYTLKADAGGYNVQTGPTATSYVSRSLQRKLDEVISVKDFGAIGDGLADDTLAINRAMFQIYCRETATSVRRRLYFPAGVYKISSTIYIPSYAYIIGDGKESTIIQQTGGTVGFALADSKLQTGANIGNNAAVRPSFIDIHDISFTSTTYHSICDIAAAQFCNFVNVGFKSNRTYPVDQGLYEMALVNISSTPVLQTSSIVFDTCSFTNGTHVCRLDDDMQDIVFSGCYFTELYQPFKIGEHTDGSAARLIGPRGVKLLNNYFDEVASSALLIYTGISGVVSSYNHYAEVGNNYAGAGHPIASVIILGSDGNTSIGDIFDRNAADDTVFQSVEQSNHRVIAQYGSELHIGNSAYMAGSILTLADNTSVMTSTGLTFDFHKFTAVTVEYSITRGSNSRYGTMRIVQTDTTVTLDDEFSDNGSDALITFSIAQASGISTLLYTCTGSTSPASMKYTIRYIA